MYSDPALKKSPDGVKCRLDDYDQARLQLWSELTGMQLGTLVRAAVIEVMDRLDIGYPEGVPSIRSDELHQRQLAIQVADQVKALARGIPDYQGFKKRA
jgi:hypothetical protein